MFSNGLRTWWSLIFSPPSRRYGMWQSAQATFDRAWMPWLHNLELRMLRLQHGRAGVAVHPVLEFFVVVELDDVLHRHALRPREGQPLFLRL